MKILITIGGFTAMILLLTIATLCLITMLQMLADKIKHIKWDKKEKYYESHPLELLQKNIKDEYEQKIIDIEMERTKGASKASIAVKYPINETSIIEYAKAKGYSVEGHGALGYSVITFNEENEEAELIDRNKAIVELTSLGVRAATNGELQELHTINECVRVVEQQTVWGKVK